MSTSGTERKSHKPAMKSVAEAVEKNEALPKVFMRKLREAESTHAVQDLSALFSSNAELENLTRPTMHRMSGNAAAQKNSPEAFWRQYLAAFESIESSFSNVIDDGSTAILEWTSTGKTSMGHPIDYAGVSILEYKDSKIEKFRTYYDSAALLPHSSKSDRHYSESVGKPEINIEAGS